MSEKNQMVVGVINFGTGSMGRQCLKFTELESESKYCSFYYEVDKAINEIPMGRRTKERDDQMWDAIYKIRELVSRYKTNFME